MKTPAKDRTLFLKERALEVVNRLGELEQTPNHGIARAYNCPALRIWCTDPETSECDEFYHLDVWEGERKVLSVVWLANEHEPSEIVNVQTEIVGDVFRCIANRLQGRIIGQDVTKENV